MTSFLKIHFNIFQSFLKVAEELQVKGLAVSDSGVKEAKKEKSRKTKRLDNNSNCDSPRTFAKRVSSMGIIKMNDYLKCAGNRQQYFKEGFVNDILVVSHKGMFLTI